MLITLSPIIMVQWKGPFSTSMIMGGSVVFSGVNFCKLRTFCIKGIQSYGLCLLEGGKILVSTRHIAGGRHSSLSSFEFSGILHVTH